MNLRDLDERYVPPLAVAARRFVDRLRGAAATVRRFTERRPETLPARDADLPVYAGVAGRLRRLDDRFTRHGPLARLREQPLVGGLLVAALVAVAVRAIARGGAI